MTETLEILALVEKEAPQIVGEVTRLLSALSSAAPADEQGTPPAAGLDESAKIAELSGIISILTSQRNNLAVQVLDSDLRHQQANLPKA